MSARDDILAGLHAAESGSVGDETPEELLDAYRAEVLAEAVKAVESKLLTGESDVLVGHRAGVTDAIAAIGRLDEAGESRG